MQLVMVANRIVVFLIAIIIVIRLVVMITISRLYISQVDRGMMR